MYNKPGNIDSLPPDCQLAFSELAESLEFSAGHTICHQGDEDGYLYLLKSGSLSVISEDDRGEKRKLATITPGTFFGEINFIFGAKRVASVIADEDSEVSRLGHKQKTEMIMKMPALYNRLHDLGLTRWSVVRFLSNPLLGDICKEDQDMMLKEAVSGTYVPGTMLFDRGDRVDDFILLLSGTLDLTADQGNEKELNDGDWLLPTGGLHGGGSQWRATAVIECMVVFVPLEAMQDITSRNNQFSQKLASGCSV